MFSLDWFPISTFNVSVICLVYKSIDYVKLVWSSFNKHTENAEPFSIKDYRETADAVAKSAEELKELVAKIQVLADGKNLEALIDHIVWRAVLLLAMALLLSFLYRLAIGRLKKSPGTTQK